MSYHEFDDYLAVLGRMLRLARSQREGIACELRDHLQERLAELSAEGVPQEVAIGKALEEFGDAAVLAAQFIQISRNRRRRWIMRCTMGVTATAVAAVLVAFAVWPGSHPAVPDAVAADPSAALSKVVDRLKGEQGHTAKAILRVAIGSAEKHETRWEYDLYRNTQRELLRSRPVLLAALHKPEIAKLAIVPQQADPVAWLAAKLKVDFPADSELMTVSLTTDDASSSAALVNAVVDVYMQDVVDSERTRRQQRLGDLDKLYPVQEEKVRAKRTELKELADQFGVDTPRQLSFSQEIAKEDYLDAKRELRRLVNDLRRSEVEVRVRQATLAEAGQEEISSLEIDALLQADMASGQALVARLAELNKRAAAGPPSEKLTAELKSVQEQIDACRRQLLDQVRRQRQAAAKADVRQAEVKVTALRETIELAERDLHSIRQQAERTFGFSIRISVLRSDIEQLDKSLNTIARERVELEVELRAAPRVTVLQKAEVPPAKE